MKPINSMKTDTSNPPVRNESESSPVGISLHRSVRPVSTPRTSAMCAEMGMRCSCSEKPIVLCFELERENARLREKREGVRLLIKEWMEHDLRDARHCEMIDMLNAFILSNDPKLSDTPERRGTCMAGGKAAV